jgi:N6-adenosine-specific RNA methylase IME4
MGNYFRGQTEHVLFAVRGSQLLRRHDVGTVFRGDRGDGHSAKPKEIYGIVESCSPGPYLEMFSRSERPDWASWGKLMQWPAEAQTVTDAIVFLPSQQVDSEPDLRKAVASFCLSG